MKPTLRVSMIILMVLPTMVGCATGGGNQVQNVVYDTNRRVANLEQNLQGSVQKLNETAAGLLARVDANDQALRQVVGGLEENQARLDAFDKKLDALIRTYHQQRTMQPAPTTPGAPQSEVEVGDQDFKVEEPKGAPVR